MTHYRIDDVVTKTGDKGETSLGDGTRVPKDDLRIECYSTLDELNASIGVIRAHGISHEHNSVLARIQNELFDAGAELAVPGLTKITENHIDTLEQDIGRLNAMLEPLKEFILPGGSIASAQCHQARTICRRAERRMVTCQRTHPINAQCLIYINRLSDLLFVLARAINKEDGHSDVLWHSS